MNVKKKIITLVATVCLVMSMSVSAFAANTVFEVEDSSGGFLASYTGTAKYTSPSSSSYHKVDYLLYGSAQATKMSCKVNWTYTSGGVSSSGIETKYNCSSMNGSKSNGPKGSYRSANVTFSVTYGAYTKSSSAKAF